MKEFDDQLMGYKPENLSVFNVLDDPGYTINEDGAAVFRSDDNVFHFSTGLEGEVRVFTDWRRDPETGRKNYDKHVETDIHINLGQADETEIGVTGENDKVCEGFSSGYQGCFPMVGCMEPCTDVHIHATGIYELDFLINVFGRVYEMLKKQRKDEYDENKGLSN